MFESNNSDSSQNVLDTTIATSEFKVRLIEVRQAQNPVLEAARTLLRAASDMRAQQIRDNMYDFQEMLVREVKIFQNLAEQAHVRREHIIAARYALCTALDEFAGRIDWLEGVEAWSTRNLLVTFHKESYGGDKFFQLLGRLAQNPAEHRDVLELMSHLLGLGYSGRYATATDGAAQLHTIRQRLYALLYKDDKTDTALSLNWKGVEGKSERRLDVPLWLTAGILVALLLGLFGFLKYQLSVQSNPLEARIEQIGDRKPAVVKTVKPLNLAQLLKNEIARGVVKVSEQDNRTSVVFTGDNMFAPGSADVNETIKPTLDKVASEINLVSGKVVVTGHTDSSPIRSEKFADNQALSEQRAKSVSEYLQKAGIAVDRLLSEGKGDTQPVADNKTAQGKAKNRRVEVLVIQ